MIAIFLQFGIKFVFEEAETAAGIILYLMVWALFATQISLTCVQHMNGNFAAIAITGGGS
jgi:hypothetical protein